MFDVTSIIQSGGLLLVGLIVFSEVALFLGFFLPGDTLLIAAGIYASQGHLPIVGVIAVVILAAIAGDTVGYFTGRKLGPRVFTKPDSLLFQKDHIRRSEEFYEKYGAKTLLVAHFIPVIRSFAPLLAGVGNMPYRKFLFFDVIGDISWAVIVTLAGYYIGSKIPNLDHYILAALAVVIAATALPTLFHLGRRHAKKRKTARQKAELK